MIASRAMIVDSAIAGQPVIPRARDSSPSSSWAPAVRARSWLCWASTPPRALMRSRASRMRSERPTHMPSSLNMRTAARLEAMASRSASSCPARPFVTAPIG